MPGTSVPHSVTPTCPECGAVFPENCLIVVDGHIDFAYGASGKPNFAYVQTYEEDRTIQCCLCGWEETGSDDPDRQMILNDPFHNHTLQWG